MYTQEQRKQALEAYEDTQSVTQTIRLLGYPGRQTLYKWLSEQNQRKQVKSRYRGENTQAHPRHPAVKIKLEAIRRCFEDGEDVQSVSDEIGYSRASIYTWRRKYLRKGMIALMNSQDKPRGKLIAGAAASTEEISELQSKVENMQMEIDILKETISILKKDPGVDQKILRNWEKTAIIDALRNKYSLSNLLRSLCFPRSSYYYQQTAARQKEKYGFVRTRMQAIFEENHLCYGYRRIHAVLRREGLCLSEKVIRRIMKEEKLHVMVKKRRAYRSYQGEITPAVPNVIERNFRANHPNEKWLTDITEFAIPAGKVYLSPIIDCFDGLPVCWRVGTTPNAALANSMLDEAISGLKEGEHPLIHTDRGCHYRWPGWVSRMDNAQLRRSMSKKGCSPDNSACEGFFGRMKNEMFYGLSWLGVSLETFIQIIHDYLNWYRNKRIKISLGGFSPLEHRQNLGLLS